MRILKSMVTITVFWNLMIGCVSVQTISRQQITDAGDHASAEPLASPVADSRSVEVQLKHQENRIKGRHELEQYSRALPYFDSTQEQLSFLNLPDFKARAQWLKEKSFWMRIPQTEAKYLSVIQAQDIAVGMPDELVKKSWGEPQEYLVSGQSYFRNARWVYTKSQSTQDGLVRQKRVVYIESGRVVGWDVF